MKSINKIIKEETILVKIKKKSDISFWHYQILGLLSFFTNNSHDYFIITNRRIIIEIKGEIIINQEYSDFKKLNFNALNDTLKFSNKENIEQTISLQKLRLSYEEIQYIKSVLT